MAKRPGAVAAAAAVDVDIGSDIELEDLEEGNCKLVLLEAVMPRIFDAECIHPTLGAVTGAGMTSSRFRSWQTSSRAFAYMHSACTMPCNMLQRSHVTDGSLLHYFPLCRATGLRRAFIFLA